MLTLAALCNNIRGPSQAQGNAVKAQRALAIVFAAAFSTVAARMALYVWNTPTLPVLAAAATPPQLAKSRPDIVDRNGRLLATDIRVYWLYANPRQLINGDEAAEKIAGLFPDLDQAALAAKFRDKMKTFEWVKRELTPKQAEAVFRLGVPGFYLLNSVGRVYPAGSAGAQVIGATKFDNTAVSGIERYIDQKLSDREITAPDGARPAVKLSLDLGVQHVLEEELSQAKDRYRAQAAMGLVLDVHSGEVLASTSLPDFDPNRKREAADTGRRNRVVLDDCELGSVFKTFTVAMALEYSLAGPKDRFDATPLGLGRFILRDPHATGRAMTVEDIFVHSSNTGAARIALTAGVSRQKQFLQRLGLFNKLETEAGVSSAPILPKTWGPASVMTIAYGHGIAVSPLLFASAAATLVNGGKRVKPTFLFRGGGANGGEGEQLVKPETSAAMRDLMQQVVLRGTGRRAAVPGIEIGGKTGTALKVKNGRYTHDVVNSFVAAFPINQPKYLVMVTLDEPKPEAPGKQNEASANAAPTAGAIIKRIAPMLNVLPTRRFDEAVASSYEQLRAPASLRISSRNKSHETGGLGPGRPAFRRPERIGEYRNIGVDGR